MFALSPLTAVLVGRLGTRPVVLAGLALLAASAAGAAGTGGAAQTVPLFALGYAWNLCFVAGSTVLAAGADVADRLRVEGRIDALVWSVAALAALLSTVLLSLGGTAALAAAALLIAATAAAYRPGGRDRRDRRAGPVRPDRGQRVTGAVAGRSVRGPRCPGRR
jgi:MFS family permease